MLKSAKRPDAEASKGDTESFGQAPDVFWLQGGKVDIGRQVLW